MRRIPTSIKTTFLVLSAISFTAAFARADTYSSTNFQSDIPGLAAHVDPNLVNPWGMAASSGGTIWVSDNGTGVSTLYKQDGTARPLVVSIILSRRGTRRSASATSMTRFTSPTRYRMRKGEDDVAGPGNGFVNVFD